MWIEQRPWRRPYDATYFDIDTNIIDESSDCVECGASYHDVVAQSLKRKERLCYCVFCGSSVWVDGLPDMPPETSKFPSGRYEGKTIEEVLKEPKGRAYVEWVASKHFPISAACKIVLDGAIVE